MTSQFSRVRDAWRAAHAPVPGVPRWAVACAYAVPLVALPSSVWRIVGFVFDAPMVQHVSGGTGPGPSVLRGGPWWYIVALSVVSEAVAFLAVGLVAGWGEVWPRWVPLLRGRRTPVPLVVTAAGLGAVGALVFPYALVMYALGLGVDGRATGLELAGWQQVVFWLAYAPLALWGPLVAVLAVHHHRRRTA
ncbi:hypothetical protein [Actinocatenispora rupis]|uniref:Uncharacterized protein n=1 Tax=Actinocatenispora rupis TaxID=519421 RepID=A0A8J3J989_9ACTN|nr:hypothetical protein [Actinocatenispora rupis]GID12492.1 hypothetical protein Aru02nite_33810 [Actinocatenispora rupis]